MHFLNYTVPLKHQMKLFQAISTILMLINVLQSRYLVIPILNSLLANEKRKF